MAELPWLRGSIVNHCCPPGESSCFEFRVGYFWCRSLTGSQGQPTSEWFVSVLELHHPCLSWAVESKRDVQSVSA